MERSVPLVLLLIGAYVSFWAGGKWRHYRRSWADHRAVKADLKKANAKRWLAFRVAWLAVFATLLYLVASATISLSGQPLGR